MNHMYYHHHTVILTKNITVWLVTWILYSRHWLLSPASHYLLTMTKHRPNESFTKNWCYTIFANNNKTYKIKISPGNWKFAKHDENHAAHYFSFVTILLHKQFMWKFPLSLSKNCLPGETKYREFHKKKKVLRNTANQLSHTIHVAHQFRPSSVFLRCSQIVCSRPYWSTVFKQIVRVKIPFELISELLAWQNKKHSVSRKNMLRNIAHHLLHTSTIFVAHQLRRCLRIVYNGTNIYT